MRNAVEAKINQDRAERERQEQAENGKCEPFSRRCVTVAQGMSMRGCNQKEIAKALGISGPTLTVWKKKYPEFAEALRTGRELAADLLRGTALQMATGQFRHVETKLVFNKDEGCFDVQKAEVTLPPDPGTLKYMLKSLDPEYSDEHNVNLGGDGIQVDIRVTDGAQ